MIDLVGIEVPATSKTVNLNLIYEEASIVWIMWAKNEVGTIQLAEVFAGRPVNQETESSFNLYSLPVTQPSVPNISRRHRAERSVRRVRNNH